MSLIVVAVACLIASATGVGAFTRWAERTRLLDVPNDRSSHYVPTPRGAGVVLVFVIAAAMAWAAYAGLFNAGVIAAAAVAIAIISAVDDVKPLPSSLRLLVHFACAVPAVLVIAKGAGSDWALLTIVLAVLWMVGLTNGYNFMDGIDGIAGMQAVVSGVTITIAAVDTGLPGVAVGGAAIASASAGFLLHNWSPARVFMGDVGSAFLGFALAVMALQIATVSRANGLVVVLSLWPFVFDTALTLTRRLFRGENIFASHRSHLYQRLVAAGWSHARVTMIYAAMAAVGAAAGFASAAGQGAWPVLATVPVMALGICTGVIWSESAATNRSSSRGGANAPVR